jgi:hypothetical protein
MAGEDCRVAKGNKVEAREQVTKSVYRPQTNFAGKILLTSTPFIHHDFDLGHGFLCGHRASSDPDTPTVPTTRRGRCDGGGDSLDHPGRNQEEEKEESEESQQSEGRCYLSCPTSHANSRRRGESAAAFVYQQEQALEIHQFIPRSFSSLI